MDSWICQTPTASPAEPGGLPSGLDREDITPGSMAIVDYKTSTDTENAAHNFQLAIYAAAGRTEGIDVRAAYVHDLRDGKRMPIAVDAQNTDVAKNRAQEALVRISNREFAPKKSHHCSRCDVRYVCRHGSSR
jgi:DNA helicase II / ATP-dependent DNA helicase PcrA